MIRPPPRSTRTDTLFPYTTLFRSEGIRVLTGALPVIIANPADVEARAQALYGAWLCGTCLGQVGMALHHKICHTLGGLCDLPHAETHSIILPHAMAYNHVATDAMDRIARALGVEGNAAVAKPQPARRLGAPMALREIGRASCRERVGNVG